MPRPDVTPSRAAASRNIEAVIHSLEKHSAQRSLIERAADRVTRTLAKPTIIAIHACFYGGWMAWNALPLRPRFDPFPFSLLNLTVSLEAILLTLLVLMTQSRMRRQADHHAHLDLQVNLLAELESTKMLGMMQSLCAHFGLDSANDGEIAELRERTDPETLLDDIKQRLPGQT